MKKIIVVVGASGNLGERIVGYLTNKEVEIRAIVREPTNSVRIQRLEHLGAKVYQVDMQEISEMTEVCRGASCVVSALAGLSSSIIDIQKMVLEAAIAAGVPRFIPSDYSLDFTHFSHGENRNLDLRRVFHEYLDKSNIAATSIFNGAFMDMLTNEMPLILFKQKMVLYWGDADHRLSFTTIDNTAEYTANVALEDSSPRYLRIAGDQLSPKEIRAIITDISQTKYRLFKAGGPKLLSGLIKVARFFEPGDNVLYPAWQGMQYMRNMIDERAILKKIDNDRYPNIQWTSIQSLLSEYQKSTKKNEAPHSV